MPIELAVIMDPIDKIKVKKDSTFALLLEAQKRNWVVYVLEQHDLYLRDGVPYGAMRRVTLKDNETQWVTFTDEHHVTKPMHELNVILMRKDPPFDMQYLYTTYLLEQAEKHGALVLNKPQSLRDANEKLFTAWFPECCPPTLVSSHTPIITDFLNEHQKAIFKPLDSMGGHLIFLLNKNDPNLHVVIETLTHNGKRPLMVQKYIPEIRQGDKRILMIDGEPYPYALNRIPKEDETRGNLAAGGKGVGIKLTDRDHWICQQVGPTLRDKGLFLVGLDVIGDYLIEINVTSPTCIREIDTAFNVNVSEAVLDAIEKKLN